MRRPTSLRVGPYDVRIQEDDHFLAAASPDGEGTDGLFYPGHPSITVKRALPPQFERQVFLHELMHACLWVSGHQLAEGHAKKLDDIEEYAISLLSPMLFGVLQQNPRVVAWLLAAE